MKTAFLFIIFLFSSILSLLSAQTSGLSLSLLTEQQTLLESERGTFIFILENPTTQEVNDIEVALTHSFDVFIVDSTVTTTNGTFDRGFRYAWTLPSLAAGESDTLQLEIVSRGYASFVMEVTSITDTDGFQLLDEIRTRCVSTSFSVDDPRTFYQCGVKADEVLYPRERFQVNFVDVTCVATGPVGCGTNYDVVLANTSSITSAPLNLFLRADRAINGETLYWPSGSTLEIPSIPANDTLRFTADFGSCLDEVYSFTVESLTIGLTQSDPEIFMNEFSQAFPEDSESFLRYCTYSNQTDIEVIVESNGLITSDNKAEYKVFVTNLGNETAESIQIANEPWPNENYYVSLSLNSSFPESNFSTQGTNAFFNQPLMFLWDIKNLAPGDTAVMTALASTEFRSFVDDFSFNVNVYLSENSAVDDPNSSNNGERISFSAVEKIDLALKMESAVFPVIPNEPNSAILTLTNEGRTTATNIEVTLDLSDETQIIMVDSLVHTASAGTLNPVSGTWEIDELPSGSTATLEIQYIPLVEDYRLYAQITSIADGQEDVDSTPGNGSCCVANEDDEAMLIPLFPPYTLSGEAIPLDTNTYRLTRAQNSQAGAIWSKDRVDLTQDFSLNAALYLGDKDGADGIAFVLQPLCSSLGDVSRGEFIGYGGISPSLIVEFDTYRNDYDPVEDHVAILKNGNGDHRSEETISDPIIVDDLEDGNFHPISILWEADSQQLTISLDEQVIYNDTIGNIISNIFLENELVFWGFTAATGGENNEHIVRVEEIAATTAPSDCDVVSFVNEQIVIETKTELIVFPNPVSSMLNYHLSSQSDSSIKYVELYDLQGRRLLINVSSNGLLSLETVPKGMYILLVHTQRGQYRQLVVKE
ncbi:MAG: T9SS type A sorting domain-containing protein [Bacteroidota bacterium]